MDHVEEAGPFSMSLLVPREPFLNLGKRFCGSRRT